MGLRIGVILVALVLVAIAASYSLWLERLEVGARIIMGDNSDPPITGYKGATCCIEEHCCHHHIYCSPLNSTQLVLDDNGTGLEIRQVECCPEHRCCCCCHEEKTMYAVGFIVENNGSIPVRLYDVSIRIYGNYTGYTTAYFIYRTTGGEPPSSIWDIDPCSLPLPGYNTSILLEPGDKAVAWVLIAVDGCEKIDLIAIRPLYKQWNTP